jgi:hypothetical protein
MVLDTAQDHRRLLTIAFDYKRPTATFTWLDTGETVEVTYVATMDRVMHLATTDQWRIADHATPCLDC